MVHDSTWLENSPGIASCREANEGDRATLHPAGKYKYFDPHSLRPNPFYANRNFTSFGDLLKSWNILIFCKFAVVAVMVCIHFYRGSILNKKNIESAAQANEAHTAGLRKLSLDLVKITT